MKLLIGQEEPCTSISTIQIREGEQESEEVDNAGDISAINPLAPEFPFKFYHILYLICE